MNKKRQAGTPWGVIGPADDAQSLYHEMVRHLDWLKVRRYSERTLRTKEAHLRKFIEWCDERGLTYPQEVTRPVLERYQRHLHLYRTPKGPLSGHGQIQRLVTLKVWFSWQVRQHRILSNPAADLEMPRREKRLPKHILSASEVERILNGADVGTLLGLRDRAMLETFYSTGIRRLEMIGLQLEDVDYERGTLMVRQGKGYRDRLVPIGERALAWVRKYADEARAELMPSPEERTLFLTTHGGPLGATQLSTLVSGYIRAAGMEKSGSCHLFRHAMATLMLENGADVRFVQAMLGHADLSTTQVYTQVAIRALKEIHTATHPARLERDVKKGDAAIDAEPRREG
ncbi:site-specific tyrosine recombinase XerC [Trinickia mobilis]|uniref:site-specific tyrosine recombinase XerC n=1 Tax=Trinickia mobilis TaxID=2816356 RepID=UPI001A8C2976|nr:site-specific tyrosine recombinase XerC [Trinickia mobilis]